MRVTGQQIQDGINAGLEILKPIGYFWIALFAVSRLTTAAADETPPPPYFVGKVEAVVIGVGYDESRIREMLPKGVQMAPGATGQIVLYTATDSYGFPPYSSTFAGVDLEGFDAPGGAKARWMLTGLYGPENVSIALAKYFDYPVREGATRLEHDGQRVVAIGTTAGHQVIRAEVVLKPESCKPGTGLIHEVTRKSGTGGMQLIKIPYVADWCPADSAKIDITAPTSDPLGRLSSVKVLWAGIWRGGFGWSSPVSGH